MKEKKGIVLTILVFVCIHLAFPILIPNVILNRSLSYLDIETTSIIVLLFVVSSAVMWVYGLITASCMRASTQEKQFDKVIFCQLFIWILIAVFLSSLVYALCYNNTDGMTYVRPKIFITILVDYYIYCAVAKLWYKSRDIRNGSDPESAQ